MLASQSFADQQFLPLEFYLAKEGSIFSIFNHFSIFFYFELFFIFLYDSMGMFNRIQRIGHHIYLWGFLLIFSFLSDLDNLHISHNNLVLFDGINNLVHQDNQI